MLVKRFEDRFSRLDVLVNNAGGFYSTRWLSNIGVEQTFSDSYQAPFLLANLLLNVVKKSAPACIVNVSSDAHRYGKINFEDLAFNRFYFGMLAYARSILANVLFIYPLDSRLKGYRVTVNALPPGDVGTDMWRTSIPLLGFLVKRMMGLFA